jgi:GNAT superfamily N-acetyltransferase
MAELVFRRPQQEDAERAAEIVFAGDQGWAKWMPAGWEPVPYEQTLEEWRRAISDPRRWNLAAGTPQGRLVAVLSMGEDADDPTAGYLSALFVEPEVQGTGVGAALLARCEEEWTRRGKREGHLWTPMGAPAAGFYARHGWVPNGRILWWEAAGMNIVGFVKPLRGRAD